MQKGGRKIRRSTRLYGNRRKSKVKSFLTIIFTLIIVVVLVFLGYSIAEPVSNFLKQLNEESDSEPWSPEQAEKEEQQSETSETKVTTKPAEKETETDKLKVFTVDKNDLNNANNLYTAVLTAKANGYNAIAVQLKVEGGELYYKSTTELAATGGLSKTELTAQQIAQIIKQNNMKAIARVNIMRDSLACYADKTAGYIINDSTQSAWYDNSPSNGGKPWLSPFSDTAKTYLTGIANELSDTDFDKIVCEDLIFPTFRNSDLNYLGEFVSNPERYKALISVYNIFKDTGKNKNKEVLLSLNAEDIISNKSEVLKPEELNGTNVEVDINISALGDNFLEIDFKENTIQGKIGEVMDKVKEKTGTLMVKPCIINDNGTSEEEIYKITEALKSLGYNEYSVR